MRLLRNERICVVPLQRQNKGSRWLRRSIAARGYRLAWHLSRNFEVETAELALKQAMIIRYRTLGRLFMYAPCYAAKVAFSSPSAFTPDWNRFVPVRHEVPDTTHPRTRWR